MLTVFLANHSLVHHKFIPDRQMVIEVFYLLVLKRICEKILQKWPYLWKEHSWILHDNSSSSPKVTVLTKFESGNTKNGHRSITLFNSYTFWSQKENFVKGAESHTRKCLYKVKNVKSYIPLHTPGTAMTNLSQGQYSFSALRK